MLNGRSLADFQNALKCTAAPAATPRRTRGSITGDQAPSREAVREWMASFHNTSDNRNDVVAVIAEFEVAAAPWIDELWSEFEERLLEYPGSTPEYFEHIKDSDLDRDRGWSSLCQRTGQAHLAAQSEFDDTLSTSGEHAAPKVAPAKALPVLHSDDISQTPEPVFDFVEDVLLPGQMSCFYGESGVGKTFVVSHLAMCVSLGWAWSGRETDRTGVLYVAAEGGAGFKLRHMAFRKAFGFAETSGMWFAIVPHAINLRDKLDADALILAAKENAARMGGRVGLIVIDTLSRALAGGNENAPDDMGALVREADRVRAETGAHVLFVAHSGKDDAKGIRGHSLYRAALDTEGKVESGENGTIILRITKQRDLEIGGVFTFKLKTVELGTNRRGKPITSCVVETVAKSRTALSETEGEAVEILETMLFESDGTTILNDTWRDAVVSRFAAKGVTNSVTRRKQWQRTRDGLIKRGIIGVSGENVSMKVGGVT
jgi:hypothetical protein